MAISILEPEAGIWYGVCWIVVGIRLISRRMHLGAWKHLQLDDYLIVVSMITATVLLVLLQKVIVTNSNLIPEGVNTVDFSLEEINTRIYGSKLVLVVEQMQISTIWLIKACLLIMYNRMTLVLPQHRIVIATTAYTIIGFIIMEVLYFGVWCRPFNQYWAFPTSSEQCSAATNHLITNAFFNISSDLIILSIPLPLLFKVRLPTKNKAILLAIFLVGAFTIVAAILNKYYSFRHPFGTEWTLWYLREAFTAILCANLPLTYPLIQRIFRLRNWSDNAITAETKYEIRSPGQGTMTSSWTKRRTLSPQKTFGSRMRSTESQENMNFEFDESRADNGPQFITSAIPMDAFDLKPHDPSLCSSPPRTWRSSHGSQDAAISRAV